MLYVCRKSTPLPVGGRSKIESEHNLKAFAILFSCEIFSERNPEAWSLQATYIQRPNRVSFGGSPAPREALPVFLFVYIVPATCFSSYLPCVAFF